VNAFNGKKARKPCCGNGKRRELGNEPLGDGTGDISVTQKGIPEGKHGSGWRPERKKGGGVIGVRAQKVRELGYFLGKAATGGWDIQPEGKSLGKHATSLRRSGSLGMLRQARVRRKRN